ncbi:hypothetical protein NDU88_004951 [Pleurodeles waltl]|uniref:Uncharacterized protein n=1 Tax=Pleurodeles waltl TaxID=8319 RepID=A0AAV7T907_PLEWA|nr:hypothetical protein NDU88_004951 [Pleurodeles waltl]
MENVFFPQVQLHWIQECLEFLLLEIGRFALQAAPRMNCPSASQENPFSDVYSTGQGCIVCDSWKTNEPDVKGASS